MNILIRILGLVALLLAAPHMQAAETKAKSTEAKGKAGAKIDINTADAATLQTLPGVGPATAQAIIAARPFSSVDDLEKVSGIGAAKLTDLKPMVRASRGGGKDADASKGGGGAKSRGDEKKSDRGKEKAKSSAMRGKINVNTADAATLGELPGVGPATARAIVAARPFSSVDDLERVPGIGAARLAELREQVTVSRAGAQKPATSTSSGTSRSATRADERERDLEPTGRVSPVTPSTTPPRTSTTSGADSTMRRATTGPLAHGKVNLNTATLQELEALPEIGPVKAQAIIQARPFSSVEDVMRVKGIKEGTLEAIKDKVTVR